MRLLSGSGGALEKRESLIQIAGLEIHISDIALPYVQLVDFSDLRGHGCRLAEQRQRTFGITHDEITPSAISLNCSEYRARVNAVRNAPGLVQEGNGFRTAGAETKIALSVERGGRVEQIVMILRKASRANQKPVGLLKVAAGNNLRQADFDRRAQFHKTKLARDLFGLQEVISGLLSGAQPGFIEQKARSELRSRIAAVAELVELRPRLQRPILAAEDFCLEQAEPPDPARLVA